MKCAGSSSTVSVAKSSQRPSKNTPVCQPPCSGQNSMKRTLGVVGRGGADRRGLRLDPQLLGLGPDAVGERRGAGMLLRDAGGKRDDGADGTGRTVKKDQR